jgi:hypothetical protein
MRKIPVGHGKFALVDDEDYKLVSKWSWCLLKPNRYVRHGYATASVNGQCGVLMHRLIMGTPPSPDLTVDHINRNSLDNRRSNLRWATRQQQQWNAAHVRGVSKYKGVSRTRRCKTRPWHAQMRVNGRVTSLGFFATELEAALAYDAAAVQARGEFAHINFPEKFLQNFPESC